MKSLLSPSWKTTAGGLVFFLATLFGQLHNLFDGDDKTTLSVEVIVAAFGILYAAFNARDNRVSSEQARR
jgi:hypothetical protein